MDTPEPEATLIILINSYSPEDLTLKEVSGLVRMLKLIIKDPRRWDVLDTRKSSNT